jgi:IS605 OrfB family transposase
MLIQKTIKAKIQSLTKIKAERISQEYQNFQLALRGEKVNLYSATKQQAERYARKIKRNGGKQIAQNHPLVIRRDLVKIEKQGTRISKFWARVPVFGGSIWVPIQFPLNQEELLAQDIREAKLAKRKNKWFLHLTVQKEVSNEIPTNPNRIAVIGIDLGEANPAISVVLLGGKPTFPRFHAREVRAVRAHYSNLRKQIGKKKLKHALRVIKRIGSREQRVVEHHLYVASKRIVEQAKQLRKQGFEPVIVVGDLKRVRKQRVKGKARYRKNLRKIHSMPSYKLKKFIWYKALWEEIPVVFQNEAYTTQTCHRCGSKNTVVCKRYFKCLDCGLEYNRDLNPAINIGNRFLDQWFKNRAVLAKPLTPTLCNAPKGDKFGKAMFDGRIPLL